MTSSIFHIYIIYVYKNITSKDDSHLYHFPG